MSVNSRMVQFRVMCNRQKNYTFRVYFGDGKATGAECMFICKSFILIK